MGPSATMDPLQSISNPAQTLSNSAPPFKPANGAINGTATAAAPSAPAKMAKPAPPPAPVAPRLEVAQSFYEELKGELSKEHWATYTGALNKFLSGKLSEDELREQIKPFLTGRRVRLHNNLLSSMIANMLRDGPGAEVAAWVSATDKPNSLSKLPAGDVTERKLKKEVMAISARERRRIKEVPEMADIEDMLGGMLADYHISKQIKPPDMLAPRSASLAKTNWDSEIRQRYTLPLSSESGEFPDLEALRHRLLPICYESGVHGGCTHDTTAFMNLAAEAFVREVLLSIISRVRSNGPNYVQTDKYRKLAPRGRWIEDRPRPLLGMHDVRLSMTLGDNFLAQLPLSMKKIMAGGWFERDYEVDLGWQYEDNEEMGDWEGAGPGDRQELRGVLEECLGSG